MIVEEREYARLLGYPWGTRLEGDVRERAVDAAEWYERHTKPRVYCVSPDDVAYTVTAITAGREVDAEVDRLWNTDRVDEAYFLDRYAAAVVEKLAHDLGPYQSPGTGKLPFDEQWKLFSYIAPLNPEIEILSSGMLRPKNSILAIVSAGMSTSSRGVFGDVSQRGFVENGLPSFAKEGWTRPQEDIAKHPLKERTGWLFQATSYLCRMTGTIGGLKQPPRLRRLRMLRSISFMAQPPLLREGGESVVPQSHVGQYPQKARVRFQNPCTRCDLAGCNFRRVTA